MNHASRRSAAACAIVLSAAASVSSAASAASGELLLQELRAKIAIERQSMNAEDLQAAGDAIGHDADNTGNVVACSAGAVDKFRAGENGSYTNKYDTYIYNANFTRALLPMGGERYCVYLVRPIGRGLSVDEARDLFVAEWMTFPSYTPTPAEQQAGEEELVQLRAKARSVWSELPQARREAIDQRVDRMVECTPGELAAGGAWAPRHAAQVTFDDLGFDDFTWDWAHSADGDTCLYSAIPLHRALTVDEARDILTLTQKPIPPTQFTAPVSPNGAKRKSGGKVEPSSDGGLRPWLHDRQHEESGRSSVQTNDQPL